MVKFIWLILNIFLILLILIRTPNNGGFESFATKSNLLGSPNSTQRFLNKMTWVLIAIYFALALKLNFSI